MPEASIAAGRCDRVPPAKLCNRNDIFLPVSRHAHAIFTPFLRQILRHSDDIRNLQCTSYRRHPPPRRSRAAKNPRALGGRGPRGIDIINQQDVAVQYPRWIAHRKSASHVLAPLMASQANLASGFAAAHQDSRAQIKPFRTRQLLKRSSCNHLCLIESALCLLARMQGNGDDRDRPTEDGPYRHRLLQVGNRLRQHAPQNCRRGTNLLELEQMDQVAQFTVIAAVGNRALERRIFTLAEQAPRFRTIRLRPMNVGWEIQGFSANGAVRPLKRSKPTQTSFTNGKPGNSNQRGTTDTAIGGKKREE